MLALRVGEGGRSVFRNVETGRKLQRDFHLNVRMQVFPAADTS